MNHRSSSHRSSGQSRHIDLSRLPVTHEDKGSKVAGIFLILFALLFGGIPTFILLTAISDGSFEPAMLFLLIFTLIGVASLVAGIGVFTHRKTIRIDGEQVSVDSRSVFGHKTWTESLSRYQGILLRSEHHSGGKNSSSYTLYIVELYHEDRKKRIRLYQSLSPSDFRRIWQESCRYLNMPGLEGEEGNMTVRDAQDLDKSVRELAQEGKLDVAFDPDKPPPAGFDLKVDGGKLRITMPRTRGAAIGLLLGMLFAGVFVYIGFFIDDAATVFGIVGIVFLGIMIAATIWTVISQKILLVAPASIKVFHRTPWGDTRGTELPVEMITNIRIGRPSDNSQERKGVVLTTADRCLSIGQGLPDDALQWLQSCLLTVITR